MVTVRRNVGVPGAPRQALPGVGAQNVAPASAFGVPIDNAAQKALQIGADILAARQEKKDLADRLKVREAFTQYTMEANRAMYTAKDAEFKKTGEAAITIDVDSRLKSIHAQVTKGLESDRQRNALAELVTRHRRTTDGRVQRFIYQQTNEHFAQVTETSIQTHRNSAIAAADKDDDAGVEMDLALIAASVADFSDQFKMGEAWMKNKIAEEISKTRLGITNSLHATGRYDDVRDYVKKHKKEFVGADLISAQRMAATSKDELDAQRIHDIIIDKRLSERDSLNMVKEFLDGPSRSKAESMIEQTFQRNRRIDAQNQEQWYEEMIQKSASHPATTDPEKLDKLRWDALDSKYQDAIRRRLQGAPAFSNEKKRLDMIEAARKDPVAFGNLTRPEFESKYWIHLDESDRKSAEAMWLSFKAKARGQEGADDEGVKILSDAETIQNVMHKHELIDLENMTTTNQARLRVFRKELQERVRQLGKDHVVKLGEGSERKGIERIADRMAAETLLYPRWWIIPDSTYPRFSMTEKEVRSSLAETIEQVKANQVAFLEIKRDIQAAGKDYSDALALRLFNIMLKDDANARREYHKVLMEGRGLDGEPENRRVKEAAPLHDGVTFPTLPRFKTGDR